MHSWQAAVNAAPDNVAVSPLNLRRGGLRFQESRKIPLRSGLHAGSTLAVRPVDKSHTIPSPYNLSSSRIPNLSHIVKPRAILSSCAHSCYIQQCHSFLTPFPGQASDKETRMQELNNILIV